MLKLKRLFIPALFALIVNGFAQTSGPGDIALSLKKLNTVGSVLYIAAHPDDENTRLIGWLANEKCLRTGYLSITRGDGGQNLIGKEQGDHLGMIRTQELLAARRTDGGEQMFTRAIDFGYSKNPEETFAIWGKDSILKDAVYAIRKFRPDVLICRFGTDGSGGHGHHTASAMLAEEAFDLAGDSTKFPELNALVKPWKPKLITWNFWIERAKMSGKTVRMEVGGYNSLLGKSYGEIAAESRSMHKSQGFGVARNRGETFEYFRILKGDCDTNNLFSGVDQTWKRLKGSAELASLCKKAETKFDLQRPEAIVPILVKARQAAEKLEDDYWRKRKIQEIDELIRKSLGLYLEAAAQDFSTAPGARLKVNLWAINRSSVPIQMQKISISGLFDSSMNSVLKPNLSQKSFTWITLPENQPNTNCYWLNKPPISKGLAKVEDPILIGTPESKPALEARFDLVILGQPISILVPVMHKWVEPSDGEKYRSLEILPAVTVNLEEKAFVFPIGETGINGKNIKIRIAAHAPNQKGKIELEMPEGWRSAQKSMDFSLEKVGDETVVEMGVFPFSNASPGTFKVKANVGNKVHSQSLIRLDYGHIPIQTLLYPAEAKLVNININLAGKNIGYIPGAGDGVAKALQQVGYSVTELSDEEITNGKLTRFDAIVVGVRAYNINERMRNYYPKLMAYVKEGGNLVLQYNTNNWISSVKSEMGPFPFSISRERVTDENAPIVFTDNNSPLIKTPNLLTESDFQNWVQERGIYFASDLAPEYQAPFSMKDPGEKDQKGSLIVAPYGKGNFVYTGLALFRQLPAGVPGAYRLMANILGLPKH